MQKQAKGKKSKIKVLHVSIELKINIMSYILISSLSTSTQHVIQKVK